MERWESDWIDYYSVLGLLPTAEHEVVCAAWNVLMQSYLSSGMLDSTNRTHSILLEAKRILIDGHNSLTSERYMREHQRRASFSRGAMSDNEKEISLARWPVLIDYDTPVDFLLSKCDFDHEEIDLELIQEYRPKTQGTVWIDVQLLAPNYDRQPYHGILSQAASLGLRSLDLLEFLTLISHYPLLIIEQRLMANAGRTMDYSGSTPRRKTHVAVADYVGGTRFSTFDVGGIITREVEVGDFDRLAVT